MEDVSFESTERPNPGLPTVVVGIGNQKGGVGKTTVTVQLARALVEKGKKVLIIDLDVNAGATKHLGVEPAGFLGTLEMLVDDENPLDLALSNDDDDINLPIGLHVIVGGRKLEDLETRLQEKVSKFANPKDRLKPALEKLRGHYDYVLLDTPPSAPLPIVLAYNSADFFLLVAIPEGLAIEGLGEAVHDIEEARRFGGAHVELLGVVVGAVDRRTRLSRELIAYVAKTFGDQHLTPSIQRSTVIPTAQTNHTTIFDTDPDHVITHQFRELATSFERRVQALIAAQKALPARPATATEAQVGQGAAATPVKSEVANG